MTDSMTVALLGILACNLAVSVMAFASAPGLAGGVLLLGVAVFDVVLGAVVLSLRAGDAGLPPPGGGAVRPLDGSPL